MLVKMEVGQPLYGQRKPWNEGMHMDWDASGPMLILAYNNTAAQDVDAIRTGRLDMAFYETDPVIFLLFKAYGAGGWHDAPFSIRLCDGQDRQFDWSEEIGDGQGLTLQIVLIDARDSTIKVMRQIGCATQFSRQLRAAVLRQFERPFSRQAYDTKIAEIYRACPVAVALARRADYGFRVR